MLAQDQINSHLLNDKDFAKNIVFEKLLRNDTDKKEVIFLCSIKNDDADPEKKNKALVILSKPAFKNEQFDGYLNQGENTLNLKSSLFFCNEVYHKLKFDFPEVSTIG
jgi:m7GpppX diphosphatase